MAQIWRLPIDLDDPQDRQVATWLAAQPDPTTVVKKLILKAANGKDPTNDVLDLIPIILHEVRALHADVHQAQDNEQPDEAQLKIYRELRALRADLARVEAQETSHIPPPPENPDAARRLDNLFTHDS
jgi:hypothetical protein